MKKVFIGVAWPYVNGDIHIGHLAGYLFPSDIYARYRRFKGDEVLMVSGSDCYGTPITVAAEKKGVSYHELVDEYHPQRLELFEKLDLDYDLFTKTMTDNHKVVVQSIFKKGLEDGVIYVDSSEQYYDSESDKFLPDRYVEGECPNCGYKESRSDQCDNCGRVHSPGDLINPVSKVSGESVELKETQHYYYDWSKSDEFLQQYVPAHSEGWRKWSISETNKWLKEGLAPRAITRDIEWGVEIPDDIDDQYKIEGSEKKRIYVWFEAVIGYLSASIEWSNDSEKWKEWWYNKDAEHYYYMGKDNLVFHTLFWPFQLHSYDEKLHVPDHVIVNNFLNLDGQKFSKSRGVIIDSADIVEKYGLDAVKFYLTSIMPENADSNFTQEDFENKVNSVLVSNFGNFVFRNSKLLGKVEKLDYTKSNDHVSEVSRLVQVADGQLRNNEFKKYLEAVLEISALGNKKLQELEPWKIKDDQTKYDQTMSVFVPYLLGLAVASRPIFPQASVQLANMLDITIDRWEDDFVGYWNSISDSISLSLDGVTPLFKKIDRLDK